MTQPTIDELLRASAPAAPSARVSAIVAETRAAVERERAPRFKRRLLVFVPVATVGALALTAGAIVVNTITADVVVPISYTTDTGSAQTCTAEFAAGSAFDADDRALTAHLRGYNWTGIGQKIYDRALAEPFDPATSDLVGLSQRDIDGMSWSDAMTAELDNAIPQSLLGQDAAFFSWGSDCEGLLH